MKNLTRLIFLLLLSSSLLANDASFHMSGNHLIPVMETDISVKKEILTIEKIKDDLLRVTVYYEFFNPKDAKKIIVGFEAASPDRGKNGVAPQYDWHPYIKDFTVNMNGTRLPHKITLVADSLYQVNNQIKSLTKSQAIATESAWKDSDDDTRFNYVYYFDANFKKGLNIVKHTYTFDLTGGVHYNYAFHYILTAAMRWGNKQIDDFTLIVDMGDYQDFCINNSPFEKNAKWNLLGTGKIIENAAYPFSEYNGSGFDRTRFFIKNGKIEYKALNFRTQNELFLYSARFYADDFDNSKSQLPFGQSDIYIDNGDVTDSMSKRILRNLPFARRGYIFSTPEIQKFYSKQLWYMPDPKYRSSLESLTPEEKEWVKKWSE